jgi:hypothetical protein
MTVPANLRSAISFPLPFLDGVNRCLYYHNSADGISYACFRSGGAWRTYSWQGDLGITFKGLPGITARIDALLSTGELFSAENGIARVFSTDGEGAELAHFPLGSLTFVFEGFSGGIARLYFTQSYVIDYGLRFKVLSIPSLDIKSLNAP